jgi:signal transduction histidine kinase
MSLLSRILLGAIACLLLGGLALSYRSIRLQKPEKLLRARTRELAELSTYLLNFAEQERAQLARELHDELGGLLTAAKMDLSWLQSRAGEPLDERRLAQLGEVLDQAMSVKRSLVEQLRPSLLDHFGLATALRAHLESSCAEANLKFDAALDDSAGAVPKEVAIALFRLVQEGMTNIIRHAGARKVRLEFRGDPRHYVLKLSDDGRGFNLRDEAFRWSHGLTGMRHRIEALHGSFTLRSIPGEGTQIEVEVPRAAAAA